MRVLNLSVTVQWVNPFLKLSTNMSDRATMRPGRVSARIDHVTYMERQMVEQTGETTKW